MKRWPNIPAIIGFLIVVVFAAARLGKVRASWGELEDIAHGLVGLAVFILINAAVLLTVVLVASWLWRTVWRKTAGMESRLPQHMMAGHWRYMPWAAVLSVILWMGAGALLHMRTPGWQLAIGLGLWVGTHGTELDIRLGIMLAIWVDSILCFAILWGGYLVWRRFRGQNLQKGSSKSAH